MTAAQPRWEFHQTENGTWAWLTGGVGSLSRFHKDFGAAMADALVHGFDPTKHQWLLEDRLSVTRFAPGESPQTLRK